MNGGSARGKCNVTIGLIARSGPLAIGLGKKKKKRKEKKLTLLYGTVCRESEIVICLFKLLLNTYDDHVAISSLLQEQPVDSPFIVRPSDSTSVPSNTSGLCSSCFYVHRRSLRGDKSIKSL